ncbi:MAG: hypothetical protein HYX41_03545 [Bdellovibrio sp.]|nr:hypothetical protein [Bdellovibrio sp.]
MASNLTYFWKSGLSVLLITLLSGSHALANLAGNPCPTSDTFEQIERPVSEVRKIAAHTKPPLGLEAPDLGSFKESVDKLCKTYIREYKDPQARCSYKEMLKAYKMLTEAGSGRKRKEVLSVDEGIAIFMYTREYYTLINAILNNRAQTLIHQPYLQMLTFALRKLPEYIPPNGKVFRKDSNGRTYKEGEKIYHNGLQSFANTKDVALTFRGSNLYEVVSKSGRDVSRYSAKPHEGEVLFLPQTKFRVEKVIPPNSPNGFTTIQMTEISQGEEAQPVEYRRHTFH